MTPDFKRALKTFGGIFLFLFLLVLLWPSVSKLLPGRGAQEGQTPSPFVAAQLEKSIGFDYLISYTDNGFEPQDITINQGETVRFTNNSSESLWVVSAGYGTALYPEPGDCGITEFDSCYAIPPGEFWEFTFNLGGNGPYQNALDEEKVGHITVTPQL